ncbi:hypothetical protein SAM23877_5735 [Streptomyces ambofaciens ATCC 23877]|uniref:Uncharacterized protein n=1 Tax=Streptomyces ambofaciens (strain ATCC 23877 / 3486 / DSM 40053 / JCM 4204 / NBRC 12836 / NRRL B-2516) TaxID=278992 RepID=A0A0K2B070_STRA7|nr:hypothetical protein [Streptomyces ambofaciens]AKZ58780.1 hypothetical protein SAM23877_5735 [Streptomyces ambofaciens ATCC 23877]
MNGEWLIRGRDGRLSVYQMSNEAVLCRAERAPGGPWEVPRKVGGDQRLLPGPAIGQGADAYVHLVSWLPTASGESSVVHSTHFRPLLAALDWEPLGHPNDAGDRTGTPVVAVDAQGRAHVFVRNDSGGLSMRAQKQRGGWGPWRDLRGRQLQDVPVAAAGKGGRIEVYATAPGAILHWRQEKPGVKFELVESVATAARPGSLRALATSPERTTVFFTDADSGELCAWRPGDKPVPLVTAAGPGPVAAVRCVIDGHDCTLVAQRSTDTGRVVFAAYPSEQEVMGAQWTESGPALPADALVSLALDADERLVAATLCPSTGELRLTRRKDEPGLALGPWQAV